MFAVRKNKNVLIQQVTDAILKPKEKSGDINISDFSAGTPVVHAEFGYGVVKQFANNNQIIVVHFGKEAKKFSFPYVVQNGFLKKA